MTSTTGHTSALSRELMVPAIADAFRKLAATPRSSATR